MMFVDRANYPTLASRAPACDPEDDEAAYGDNVATTGAERSFAASVKLFGIGS